MEVSGKATSRSALGADQFAVAWRLTAAAWLGCALLQFLLYLRPSPFGGPVLIQWKTFIIRPLVYELLAVWLIALPFLLVWLLTYHRPVRAAHGRLAHWVLAGLMALNLLLTQFDHEIYRFLGLRLGPNFLSVYADPTTMGDSLFLNVLRGDRGGPFLSPLLIVAAPLLYLWWAKRLIGRGRTAAAIRPRWRLPLAIVALPLATGFTGYSLADAKFRLSRLEPTVFAITRDFYWNYEDETPPTNLAATVAAYQSAWLAASTDRNWHFADAGYPFLRTPIDPATPAPDDRWNIIIIQLESVRGIDTGHLRPDRSPTPTPYLDALARAADAAVYTRALTFGPPSVNGRFATQCSITPSSRRFITAQTQSGFYCLPDALRRHGYRAEMFAAGDIDMDNSTIWVQRMYDRLWRFPEVGQVDRLVFRRAASRIREMGRDGPFLATLISASNHHPFRSPEPELDVADHATARQRILNTTRYTDDVVREFIETLREEPWFGRTLFIINSDHGYNLGEHGGVNGAYSLYRESVWTPFLIVGPHPRLPVGRHDELVTLLDIAPTVADLIGLREANPWHGHSLLALNPGRDILFGFRDSTLAETAEWSAVTDPNDGQPRLYRQDRDWLQQRDLAPSHAAQVRALIERAERARRMNDFIIRQDRVWPRTRS